MFAGTQFSTFTSYSNTRAMTTVRYHLNLKTAWFWILFFVVTFLMAVTGQGQQQTDRYLTHSGPGRSSDTPREIPHAPTHTKIVNIK